MMTKVRRSLKFIIAGVIMATVIMILTGIRVMAADTNPSKCYQSGLYGSIPWHVDPYKDGGCSLTISYGQGDSSQPSWVPYNKDIVHVEFTDPKHTVFGPDAVWAFSGMNLVDSDSFNIKDVDMSKVRNMIDMFADTTMDAPLDLDGDGWHNTSEVVATSNMFERFHAPGIKGVGRMDTSNVTSMSNMFHEANLEDSVLDVKGMNTSKAENMGDVLHDVQAADIVGFEDWDISSATRLNYIISANMVYHRTVDLTKWDVSHVTDFQDTFEGLRADGLDLSGWKMPNLRESDHFALAATIGDLNLTGWEIGKPCDDSQCQGIFINEAFSNTMVRRVEGLNTIKAHSPTWMSLSMGIGDTSMMDVGTNVPDMTELDMSGFDLSNFEETDMISYCSPTMQSVDLSNIDFTGRESKYVSRFIQGTVGVCRDVTKVNMSSTKLNGTDDEYWFEFPSSMNELTIGKDVHLNDQSMKAMVYNDVDDKHTGRWAEVNSGTDDEEHLWESQSNNYADSSKELAARSREGHEGTYVRQRKVTITYNGNSDNDKVDGIPETVEANWPDADGGTKLPENAKRNGYVFRGWNTSEDGSGQSYKPGERVQPQDSVTLYAQWTRKTSTIRFNGNGSGSAIKPGNIEANGRPTVTIPCDVAPTKPGSTFIGWSRTKSPVLSGSDAGKKGKVEACGYSKNTSIAAPEDGIVDLYAVWARKPRATFNENRPKDMTALLPETKTVTGDWYISGLTPRTYVGSNLFGWYKGYSPDGVYRFDGWTNEGGSPFTGTYLERDNVTINAKWTRMANDNSQNETGDSSGNAGHEDNAGSSDTDNESNSSSGDETNDNKGPADEESTSNTADGTVAESIGSNQNTVADSTVDSNTPTANSQQDGSSSKSLSTDMNGGSSDTNTGNDRNDSDSPISDSKSSDGSPLARTGVSAAISIVAMALLMVTASMVIVIRRHLD